MATEVVSAKMSMTTYSMPLVYQDLRPIEAIHQSLDQLEHLSHVVEDLFARVTSRVVSERSRLETLAHRLGDSQAKVQKLYGSSRATTVLSSAKFPGPDEPTKCFPILSSEKTAQQQQQQPVPTPKRGFGSISDVPHGATPLEDMDPLIAGEEDALMFQEVREADPSRTGAATHHEGLGRLPEDDGDERGSSGSTAAVTSISSLLLFNTRENPYKKYSSFNNLEGWWTGRAVQEKPKAKELVAAPDTVLHGDVLPMQQKTAYGYRPVMEGLPTMNLPPTLPNLANVADIAWTAGQSTTATTSIAPSDSLTPFDIGHSAPAPSSSSSTATTSSIPGAPPAMPAIDAQPLVGVTTPPPPPPMPVFGAQQQQDGGAPGSLPPPPMQIPQQQQASSPPQQQTTTPRDQSGMDLMEQIRKVATLRKTKDEDGQMLPVPGGREGQEEQKKESKPLDMMSELRMRLDRRRTVLKGKQDDDEEDASKKARHKARAKLNLKAPRKKTTDTEDSGPSGAEDEEWEEDS